MFPVILLVFWHAALHFMHHGVWCTGAGRGRFACSAGFTPRGGVLVHFREMRHLIRHGFACRAWGHLWQCTPFRLR